MPGSPGGDIDIPSPTSNIEKYLTAIAGENVKVSAPKTRAEYFLDAWLLNSIPGAYRAVEGFTFDATTYYLIENFHLRGSDTVRISFSQTKACNVFGCYTSSSATDNYSLYASTSSGSKYLRYGSTLYNSYFPAAQSGTRYDVVISPHGTSGMPTDSAITPETFESSADLCIGHTSPSGTSSKLDGNIWGDIIVDGRLKLVPCERLSDDVLGYFDTYSRTFYEPIGSAPTVIDNS